LKCIGRFHDGEGIVVFSFQVFEYIRIGFTLDPEERITPLFTVLFNDLRHLFRNGYGGRFGIDGEREQRHEQQSKNDAEHGRNLRTGTREVTIV